MTCIRSKSSTFGSKTVPFSSLIFTDHYSFALPADVFVDGEIRPTKAKKKAAPQAAAKPAEAAHPKRSGSNAGLDVCDCRVLGRLQEAPRMSTFLDVY